jgi:hypothetical protein
MKLYTQQSRKKKKLSYIQLKNRIEKGYLFSTHDVFTTDMQWADIYFFGKNKQIYNATIRTIACAYYDKVHHLAWDKLKATANPDDKFFEIVELDGYKSDKNMSGPTTISNPALDSLKGLTASQFLDQAEEEIAKSGKISVKETFEILPDYVYGIGLDMVINVANLNSENIDEAIKKFISSGEKNWESEENHTPAYDTKSSFTTNAISLD